MRAAGSEPEGTAPPGAHRPGASAPIPDPTGSAATAERARRVLRSVGLAASMAAYNGLLLVLVGRRPPYPPTDVLPFVGRLEEHWPEIRGELDALLEHGPVVPPFVEVEPEQRAIWTRVGRLTRALSGGRTDPDRVDLDRWRTFVFRTYGLDVEPNRALCPKTSAALDEVPGLMAAMFSIMEPGIRLPSHTGLFLGALRVHLGLRIPPGDTGMRVGGQDHGWEEGRAFVFEHSRWHTAWNHTDAPRAVLILDVERPMRWRWLDDLNHRIIVAMRGSARTRATVAHIESLTAAAEPATPDLQG